MSREPIGPGALDYGYTRYLMAKRGVDDRALNRRVLADLCDVMPAGPPRVLEIGAGLGTMVARLLEWRVITAGEYTLLDADPQLLRDARTWLSQWATDRGLATESLPDGLGLGDLRVRLVQAELGSYLETPQRAPVDLLIANAFMDLVDLPAVLPGLLGLLGAGGVYWFTINFDGESIFQPAHPWDDDVLGAYHRTMDTRVRYGKPAGGSRTGRHLLHQLRAAGAPPLSAGSSDWVVFAGPDGTYPDDEACFLENILQTIQDAFADGTAPAHLAGWLAARRRQLADGDLLYIAHQIDVAGRAPR
jgi:hypothetical protein